MKVQHNIKFKYINLIQFKYINSKSTFFYQNTLNFVSPDSSIGKIKNFKMGTNMIRKVNECSKSVLIAKTI